VPINVGERELKKRGRTEMSRTEGNMPMQKVILQKLWRPSDKVRRRCSKALRGHVGVNGAPEKTFTSGGIRPCVNGKKEKPKKKSNRGPVSSIHGFARTARCPEESG